MLNDKNLIYVNYMLIEYQGAKKPSLLENAPFVAKGKTTIQVKDESLLYAKKPLSYKGHNICMNIRSINCSVITIHI